MGGLVQDIKLFGEYFPWFQSLRDKGLAAFAKQGIPSAKTEAWRYTKLRDLSVDDFEIEPSSFLDELRAENEESCACHNHNCHCDSPHSSLRGAERRSNPSSSSSCSGDCDGDCDCHCDSSSCHCDEAISAASCSCGSSHSSLRGAQRRSNPSSSSSCDGDCDGDCDCGGDCHCHEHELNLNYSIPFDAYQIHFVNGKFIPIFPALPKGVEIITLMEAVLIDEAKPYLGKLLDLDSHPFGALNTAYMEEGLYIRVDKDVKLDKPIMIINHTEAGERNLFYNLRYLLVLETGAEAELVEWYKYSGQPKSRYFANIVSEIFLGNAAKLKHYKFQDEAFKANHLSLTIAKVKKYAEYNNFCLQKGANIGRNEVKVLLEEEQAKANVNAAYLMSGWATLDTTTDILHLSENTYSSQLVKGVVNGEARGVFQGRIHIARDAVKTEGYQLHKALLLSDTAEIDVKPELEIFADDVKCSHGAASGELDEAQLFYMQSRGIGREEAKQILIDAYLEEVLAKAENDAVRDWMRHAL